jgi:fructokinase
MILVCGEALIDLVPDGDGSTYRPAPGGSPANVAVGLGRLGFDVALLARIAGDGFGRLLRSHLTESRVDLTTTLHSVEPTTLAVVTLDEAGRAEYAFYVDGCADSGWRPTELPAALPEGAALHVSGSLALAVPPMGDTIDLLLRREQPRRTLTLDPNLRPRLARDPAHLRTRLDEWIDLVDIVKISEDDLAWLTPDEPVEDVARRWHARGPALVVVTRGANGATALGPEGMVDLAAERVEVADTVGAGDAFMAGLLAALDHYDRLTRGRLATLPGDTLSAALTYAQHVAALTCTRVGADPPWQDEVGSPAAARAGASDPVLNT